LIRWREHGLCLLSLDGTLLLVNREARETVLGSTQITHQHTRTAMRVDLGCYCSDLVQRGTDVSVGAIVGSWVGKSNVTIRGFDIPVHVTTTNLSIWTLCRKARVSRAFQLSQTSFHTFRTQAWTRCIRPVPRCCTLLPEPLWQRDRSVATLSGDAVVAMDRS